MWFLTGFVSGAEATPRLLRFDPAVMEIGDVRYDGGVVKVVFTYTNIADKPVTVLDVHVMCRCTVPSWDHKPVAPGKQGRIEVSYDPSSFIGEQNAHMTVIATNGDYERYNTITIHGNVIRDETLLQMRHPYHLGEDLRSELVTVGLRLRKRGETVVREVSFLNDSPEPMTLRVKGSWRAKVEAPSAIGPHGTVKVKLTYRTWFMRSGSYIDSLRVEANGKKQKSLVLKGAIE